MKLEIDCSKCNGEMCCTFQAEPMGIPLRCMHCEGGKCQAEEEKPNACALYPLVIVATSRGVFLCVDTRCPEWESIDVEKDVPPLLDHYTAKDDVTVFTEEDVAFYGWKLKPLARLA